MNFYNKIFLLFFSVLSIFSCSNNSNLNTIDKDTETPEYFYAEALSEFDNQNYDLALEKFSEIEIKFPLSNEAIQSQIMSGFIEYLRLNYNEAIFKFSRIINRYPSYKNIDYAYYMRAMSYYEQIENEYLSGENNSKALENFEQTINRFPESQYAKDSVQKIILIKENIAAKHMNIALFYLKNKKYLAALNRYQIVINDFSESKFTPEASHRLVEIYYTLGMIEDAKKTASVLGYNYPKSVWYERSYKIVGEDNKKKKGFFKLF